MIMARAMNIPAVTGLEAVREIHNDDKLLVDGKTSEVALMELRERGKSASEDQALLSIWKEKFHQKLETEKALKNLQIKRKFN